MQQPRILKTIPEKESIRPENDSKKDKYHVTKSTQKYTERQIDISGLFSYRNHNCTRKGILPTIRESSDFNRASIKKFSNLSFLYRI